MFLITVCLISNESKSELTFFPKDHNMKKLINLSL